MNEKHKNETDELMTLYLDGEATQRQQTELKRLMLHDPLIAEKLNALQRQQQLMQALPVETAPDGLIDDIRAELERKLILGDSGDSTETVSGSSHLMIRRLLTTAAMLLIPLGLLSAVVYTIMKPASQGGIDYVPASKRIADAAPTRVLPSANEMGLLKELPFNGVLVLKTDEYMTVSNQVEKAIFAQGLISHTLPSRTADITSFHITAPPRMIAGLVDSLAGMWPRCKNVTLEVVRDGVGETIKISDPRNRQIKTLVYEDSDEMLNRLATRYASANRKDDTMFAKTDGKKAPQLSADGYPEPSIPTLAGSYDQLNQATIQLSIHVERNLK